MTIVSALSDDDLGENGDAEQAEAGANDADERHEPRAPGPGEGDAEEPGVCRRPLHQNRRGERLTEE